jgi:hypothetical protein
MKTMAYEIALAKWLKSLKIKKYQKTRKKCFTFFQKQAIMNL